MGGSHYATGGKDEMLEIIAFRLHDQEFCVRTTTIREIRGWGRPHRSHTRLKDVVGIMNLRGTVIPIIDLANSLVVDRVSDILTISESLLQPVPEISLPNGVGCADGIIAQPMA